MSRALFPVIFLLLFVLFEVYSYNGLKELFKKQLVFNIIYIAATLFSFYGFFKMFSEFGAGSSQRTIWSNFVMGFAFTMFVAKMVFSSTLILQDLSRYLIAFVQWFMGLFSSDPSPSKLLPGRRKAITAISAGIAAVPFLSMLYGITRGKYNYTVSRLQIRIAGLPEKFRGFKIAQISDIHSGSFDNKKQVEKGIQMINDESPDMVVFTGDLVNFDPNEIEPYIDSFARIDPPYGKYSILGNHDYYGLRGNEAQERQVYFREFESKHNKMGFKLLRNQNVAIEKEGEKINLIGVENWGAGPFPKYGDLDMAMEGKETDCCNILLSHDPTHWENKVLEHQEKIHLTLSGHTHGMQFGINLPGLKWSPIQYRYKRWMGLYEEKDQFLYINRGFGFLGFPGRVFMWPEISVFELVPA